MSTPIQTIPRAAVHGYLRLLRVPLDAAGRVVHRDSSTVWAPTVAYEAFAAGVKGAAGHVLRDDTLRAESDAQKARVDQLRKAASAAKAAAAKQVMADQELAERKEAAEAIDETAAKREQAEKERAEQSASTAKANARRRAARQKDAAAKAESRRKQAAREKATKTKAATLKAERDALLERKQAAEAKVAAQEIGDAAATTRQRRRSQAS